MYGFAQPAPGCVDEGATVGSSSKSLGFERLRCRFKFADVVGITFSGGTESSECRSGGQRMNPSGQRKRYERVAATSPSNESQGYSEDQPG